MVDKHDQQPNAADHPTILVAHMMTPGVVQIPGDVSVTEAASLMERERMSCLLVKDSESRFGLMTPTGTPILIVTKENQPVGVLTARDLLLSPKRCVTNISATVSVIEGEGTGDEHQVSISQLSHAGASVESPALLPSGTKIILSFCLSEMMSPLTIRGTVVDNASVEPLSGTTGSLMTSHRGVEIQFVDLSPADQSRIKAWVLNKLPK